MVKRVVMKENTMSNVESLAIAWLEAKRGEEEYRKARVAVEASLAEALEVPDEGSKTHRLDNYKVTLTQPVTRKLDEKAWDTVKDRVPAEMAPVRVKVEADGTGCKWLAKNEPDIWASIAEAFTAKPGKVGVKVEVL